MQRLQPTHAVSTAPRPDEILSLHELRSAIDRVLGSLTPRQELIVRRYYGFEGNGCTYDELGRELGITGSRVAQILSTTIRRMRYSWQRYVLRPHALP